MHRSDKDNLKYSKYNLFFPKENTDNYYLYNTNSGAVFLVDTETKRLIESKEYNTFDSDIVQSYYKAGILLDDYIDENKLFSYMYNLQKYNQKYLKITLLLTYECNLRCVYCYEGAGERIRGSLGDVERDSILKFIKKKMEESEAQGLSLTLFGGEPLLTIKENYEWLDSIKNYCEEKGKDFVTGIVTNGILINDEVIKKLAYYNCDIIQITLDGIKSIHDKRRIYKDGRGSFDEVMRGVQLIYESKELPNPLIRINIDKSNIEQTHKLIEYLAANGLKDCPIDFGIVKDTTAACAAYSENCFMEDEIGEILDSLWDKLAEMGFRTNSRPHKQVMFCGLQNILTYTISPKAEIYKCWDHVGMPEHLMGRINEDGDIVDISYDYIDWMSREPVNINECCDCQYLPVCGGGCASISISKYGTYHAPGCYKVKGVIEKQVRRLILEKEKANEIE